jgi:two-component system, sensor histidine kinase ChiS
LKALEINFCNHPFEILTGYPAKDILGHPVTELFHDLSADCCTGLLSALKSRDDHNKERYYSDISIRRTGQRDKIRTDICLSFPDLEGDDLGFLIIKKPGQDLSSSDLRRLSRFETLLERVSARSGNQSFREREDLKAIDDLLEELNAHLCPDAVQDTKRRLAVKVLNMTCDLWAVSTKQSKLDLAERSGIWNIYIEKDGWARTQTLDKYLKEETLPARPRWKSVLQTADFVLALCDEPQPLRKELEFAVTTLKKLL